MTSISADRRIITSISLDVGCLCPEMPVKWLDVKEMDQFKDTRSCAALLAADLDWIVEPEHEKVIIFRQ